MEGEEEGNGAKQTKIQLSSPPGLPRRLAPSLLRPRSSQVYPQAAYIELEPDSTTSNQFAIDQGTKETRLRAVEVEALNRMLKTLRGLKGERDGKNKLE